MVDWATRELNAKFWVELLLLQQVGRPFSYCETGGSGGDGVYAQALTSPKGRVLVLINTKHTPAAAAVPGAAAQADGGVLGARD